jgi:CTP:molybdopterin cytidylyltransferase MocA
MGGPKALLELDGEPLVRRAVRTLADGGCGSVVVVLGASAAAVAEVLPAGTASVVADGWATGMGASLRTGLGALAGADVDAVVVHLVDLPDVTPAAIARLVALAAPDALARAAYDGRPAHPVLLGRAHWAGVAAAATGDAGARGYLAGHPDLRLVECGDVAGSGDLDTPEQLAAYRSFRA